MASGSMKDIKLRIKSVESTGQITKAMELVASSKLRKAKMAVEATRPYFNGLLETLDQIAGCDKELSSIFLTQRDSVQKTAYVMIAGDRGLAGGYNSNMFKLFNQHALGKEVIMIPVGKKTVDFCKKNKLSISTTDFANVEDITISDCQKIAEIISNMFKKGEVDQVYLGYTTFVSMLTQEATFKQILPIVDLDKNHTEKTNTLTLYEPDGEELFDIIVPHYLSGVIYGAVAESWASELGARRTAMEAASKNAAEMVDALSLQYNRARQSAITQEITEIVSGANAQV